MINPEDIDFLAQLIESIDLLTKELEKKVNEKNIQQINKIKGEIMKFQEKIDKILI